MAVFDEVLAQIREKSGEIPDVLTAADTLATEYLNTATQLEGATLRLSEKDTALAASQAEIARLKGENYDLSIKVQSGPPPKPEPDDDDDDKPTGIASLFEYRK